jgi:hypothetical protein
LFNGVGAFVVRVVVDAASNEPEFFIGQEKQVAGTAIATGFYFTLSLSISAVNINTWPFKSWAREMELRPTLNRSIKIVRVTLKGK